MSEYWHNGSVVFDRMLTKEEKEQIADIFGEDIAPENARVVYGDISYSTFRPRAQDDETSTLEFNDYVTGHRGLSDELTDLTAYCSRRGIGIDSENSMITYCGDEDGGYCIDNGGVTFLDRDDIGVRNSSTEALIGELLRRGNTAARILLGSRPCVYVVSSCRECENGEWYFGPDTVFPSMPEAQQYVLDEMKITAADFELVIDPDAVDFDCDGGHAEMAWLGHYFSWDIDKFYLDHLTNKEEDHGSN